jgi:hypothetical protein
MRAKNQTAQILSGRNTESIEEMPYAFENTVVDVESIFKRLCVSASLVVRSVIRQSSPP